MAISSQKLNNSNSDVVIEDNSQDIEEIAEETSSQKSVEPVAKADDPLDSSFEDQIRPKDFASIIGRVNEKKTLEIMIESASKRNTVVDHILFYGPPGLGKTTFSMAIANEIGSSIYITSGPAIERAGDLAAIMTGLAEGDVLFIDEIHRLSKTVEEILYPAMEDGVLDIIMGKGAGAKSVRVNLEPFTLIGATTKVGNLSSPLRDRFGLVQRLDYFEDRDIREIISRAADIEGMQLAEDALDSVATRARGTGRTALRIYRRVRDFHISEIDAESKRISLQAVESALDLLGVDEIGLEDLDRNILKVIYNQFDGGPVGISTLAAAVSEDLNTITDVYEPYLMKKGLIKRTSRGRVLTKTGVEYVLDLGEE